MTEIRIEKKKQIWPWLLIGLVIAILLVYFIVFSDNGKTIKTLTKADSISNTNGLDLIGVKENNSTVAAYINFVENSKEKMSLDHAYTSEALTKLIEATKAIAGQVGFEIEGDLEKAKEYSKMITQDPFDTTHADNIRKASDILTQILQNIQNAKYPSLANEVEELKNASKAINPTTLTLYAPQQVRL